MHATTKTRALPASDWLLWSTTARLVITDAALLEPATAIAHRMLADIDAACSRFRTDSELHRAASTLSNGVEVSPLLANLVRVALTVARDTDGDVDPTLGYAMDATGYDRDIRLVEDSDSIVRAVVSRRPGWRSVALIGNRLRVPSHLSLDLGATAKAVAADWVVAAIVDELNLGTRNGVLLSLGGDIATAGVEPVGGWNVVVRDLEADAASAVRLRAGFALATSSTQKRRWQRGGTEVHHILNPRTGLPADDVWRTVSVSARSCLAANALSTASIVRGERAIDLLKQRGVAARLVHRDGHIVTLGGWPTETDDATAPGDASDAADVTAHDLVKRSGEQQLLRVV